MATAVGKKASREVWSHGQWQHQTAGCTIMVTLKLSPARVVLLPQDVTGYKSLEKDTGRGRGVGVSYLGDKTKSH